MKKKLVSSIIFLSIIFFVGCQRNYTGNNKDRENLKIEKKELERSFNHTVDR